MQAVCAVVAAKCQQLLLLRATRDRTRACHIRQPQLAGSDLDVFGVGHLSRVAVGVTIILVDVLSPPALPELHDLRLNLQKKRFNAKVVRDKTTTTTKNILS